jgi:GT2 family glycosyltransferase
VRLVRSGSNLGFAKGNSLGIAHSKGRYLALVYSDVKVLKDCITRLVDFCEQKLTVGMVGPRVIGGDGLVQRNCRGFPTLWNMFCRALALDSVFPGGRLFTGYLLLHWAQDTVREVEVLEGCFWLAWREAVDQVGLLDEDCFMYGEDLDWRRRFWNGGWKLFLVPAAEAIHYGGASSSNAPVQFYIKRHRADLQYWRKHHSRLAAACFFLICCLHLLLRMVGYVAVAVLRPKLQESYRYKVRRSVACLKWMLTGRQTAA